MPCWPANGANSPFLDKKEDAMKKRVFSMLAALAICLSLISVTALADGEHDGHNGWKVMDGNTTTLSSGNYYLSKNVTYNGTDAITVSGDVTLCLNGCVLDLNEQYIKVNSGASLTLCDCTDGTTSGYLGSDDLWHPRSPTDEGATTCNLTGGVITGGNGQTQSEEGYLYNCGGGVVVSGGTFTMTGGNIAGNTGSGGGVYLSKDGAFTMKGGSITGNSTTNLGGGVFVDFGTFTMEGGKITGNASASNGGGVFVNAGTFTMKNGDITDNTASGGGGVCIYSGSFTMSGGDITGNTAESFGGGVWLGGNSSMSGGSITGNTAYRGGGVFMNSGTFTLSGNPTITGNTKADETTVNNADLYRLYFITIGDEGLSPVASIGVTTETTGTFTSGWSTHMHGEDPADYFFSDRTGYHVALGSGGEASIEANTYTVNFNPNGGSGSMDNQDFTYDIAQNLTANGFTRTGYTFVGWNTAANGTGNSYGDSAYVNNLTSEQNGTVTLYAQWTVNTYTINYNLAGGTASGNPTSYTVESQAITLNDPTRTGYIFAGWTGTGLSEASTTVTIATGSTGDRNYTATWTANSYTVKFDPNGGDGGSMADQSFTYDTAQNLTGNGFTRTGYTFAGWNTAANGSGASYSNNEEVENLTAAANGSVTLYAQWTVNTYTVTLHLNGGKFVEGTQDVTSYTYGTMTLLPDAEQMTRPGYRFEGWYADEKFQDGPYTQISAADLGNKTFYARWSFINIPETHGITVVDPANGSIRVNPSNGSAGTLITVTATPDDGYELAYVTVDGEKISGSTFRMPDKSVTVSAVFVPVAFPFVDVKSGDWFYDAVAYVYSNGLMDGTSATTFEPNANMTRAMVWAILARIDGETVTGANWASAARAWAMAEGVSDGTDPNGLVTREQFATMLYRYAVAQGYDVSIGESTNILSYTDYDEISEWAIPAMQWACGSGVITGVTDSTLAPQGTATRAQAAAMLMRFVEP